MSKKKPAIKVSVEPIIDQQQEPVEEFPIRQVDEEQPEAKPESESIQAESEPVVQTESTSVVEIAPAVEVVIKPEPEPTPPLKPKPLTLISLHNEIEALRQIVEQQSALITQLLEIPARQRKSPTSNGKIQIRDKQTGKIYPSKNNVYQSLLKAGELKELVDAGVFGANPEKNSFGCYALFRSYPDRFEEVHDQEQSV